MLFLWMVIGGLASVIAAISDTQSSSGYVNSVYH